LPSCLGISDQRPDIQALIGRTDFLNFTGWPAVAKQQWTAWLERQPAMRNRLLSGQAFDDDVVIDIGPQRFRRERLWSNLMPTHQLRELELTFCKRRAIPRADRNQDFLQSELIAIELRAVTRTSSSEAIGELGKIFPRRVIDGAGALDIDDGWAAGHERRAFAAAARLVKALAADPGFEDKIAIFGGYEQVTTDITAHVTPPRLLADDALFAARCQARLDARGARRMDQLREEQKGPVGLAKGGKNSTHKKTGQAASLRSSPESRTYKNGRHRGANAMCEKCDKIDRNIRRYRWIQRQIFDQMTIDGTQKLIDKLETEKATLHPAPHGGTE
jgi:predicted nucleic acid-binding protein